MSGYLHNPVFAGFILAVLFAAFALLNNRRLLWIYIAVVALLAWIEITHHIDTLNGLARAIAEAFEEAD